MAVDIGMVGCLSLCYEPDAVVGGLSVKYS